MRLKPQNRVQWFGLIFALMWVLCILGALGISLLAVVGPALTDPIGEGESRLPGLVSSMGTFILCMVPVMLPFGAVGGFILFRLTRPLIAQTRLEPPEVIVSKESLRVGESFQVTYRQSFKRPTDVEKMLIQLVLRETATYRRGSDTYTVVHNHVHFEQHYPGRQYGEGQRFEELLALQIPPEGIHTFIATRNKLQWFFHVEIDFVKWPDFRRDFEVQVLPEMVNDGTDRF